MSNCSPKATFAFTVGQVLTKTFCVQPAGATCAVPLQETRTITDAAGGSTYTYTTVNAAGLYLTPYTGPITPVVECPQKVSVCGTVTTTPAPDPTQTIDCNGDDAKRVTDPCSQAVLEDILVALTPVAPAPIDPTLGLNCLGDPSRRVHDQCLLDAFNANRYRRDVNILCAQDGTKVAVHTITQTNAPPGTPPTIEAYQMNGAVYGGPIAGLVDCGREKYDIVAERFCVGGLNYTRIAYWDVTALPVPTEIGAEWRNELGNFVAPPVGAIKGECVAPPPPAATPNDIVGGGVTVAGVNAPVAFNGAPTGWDTSGLSNLHSLTVTARGVVDGLAGLTASQVIVNAPDGTSVALFDGQAVTFSIVRDLDRTLQQTYKITASGRARANIHYTFWN